MTHLMLEKVARSIAHECNFVSGEDGWRDELITARAAIQALLLADEFPAEWRAMLLPLVEGEGK